MIDRKERPIKAGVPKTLGAVKQDGGYNFAVEVPQEKRASLLLYRRGEELPEQEIVLSDQFRTGDIAAVFLPGFNACLLYTSRCV